MKYLKQLCIILLFTGLGEVLAALIPLPIPAAIYGIVLLLGAQMCGLVKPEKLREVSQFLISIMSVLFVAPSVRMLEYWGMISADIAPIAIIAVSTTFLVFAVSGLVTQWVIQKKEERQHD